MPNDIFKKRSAPSTQTLYTYLPAEEQILINECIANVAGITLKGSQVVDMLTSAVYPVYRSTTINFIKFLEGVRLKTYYDSEGILTIGAGFNLEQDIETSKAILTHLGLHPNKILVTDSSGDYLEGMPTNATEFTSSNAEQLLQVTLIGDPALPHWVPKGQTLYNCLSQFGLLDVVFAAPEAIALQSMAFNLGCTTPKRLIGPKLAQAILARKIAHTQDIFPEIVELINNTNLGKDAGMENRMLGTAGLYIQNPEIVTVPIAQEKRILAAAKVKGIVIVEEPGVADQPAPIVDYSSKFQGYPQICAIPSDDGDFTALGTPGSDQIKGTGANNLLLGGWGNDKIDVLAALGGTYHYVATGVGASSQVRINPPSEREQITPYKPASADSAIYITIDAQNANNDYDFVQYSNMVTLFGGGNSLTYAGNQLKGIVIYACAYPNTFGYYFEYVNNNLNLRWGPTVEPYYQQLTLINFYDGMFGFKPRSIIDTHPTIPEPVVGKRQTLTTTGNVVVPAVSVNSGSNWPVSVQANIYDLTGKQIGNDDLGSISCAPSPDTEYCNVSGVQSIPDTTGGYQVYFRLAQSNRVPPNRYVTNSLLYSASPGNTPQLVLNCFNTTVSTLYFTPCQQGNAYNMQYTCAPVNSQPSICDGTSFSNSGYTVGYPDHYVYTLPLDEETVLHLNQTVVPYYDITASQTEYSVIQNNRVIWSAYPTTSAALLPSVIMENGDLLTASCFDPGYVNSGSFRVLRFHAVAPSRIEPKPSDSHTLRNRVAIVEDLPSPSVFLDHMDESGDEQILDELTRLDMNSGEESSDSMLATNALKAQQPEETTPPLEATTMLTSEEQNQSFLSSIVQLPIRLGNYLLHSFLELAHDATIAAGPYYSHQPTVEEVAQDAQDQEASHPASRTSTLFHHVPRAQALPPAAIPAAMPRLAL